MYKHDITDNNKSIKKDLTDKQKSQLLKTVAKMITTKSEGIVEKEELPNLYRDILDSAIWGNNGAVYFELRFTVQNNIGQVHYINRAYITTENKVGVEYVFSKNVTKEDRTLRG